MGDYNHICLSRYGKGSGWRAVYGSTGGIALPMPLARFVGALWNNLACRLWGHNDSLWHLVEMGHIPEDESVCCDCCKRLTACTCTAKQKAGWAKEAARRGLK